MPDLLRAFLRASDLPTPRRRRPRGNRQTNRRDIRQIAIKGQTALARAIETAVEDTREAIDLDELAAAIEAKDLARAEKAIPIEAVMMAQLSARHGKAYRRILEQAGQATLDEVG